MIIIMKALLVLFLELIICWCFGTIINNRILKNEKCFIENLLIGFFCEQAFFQVLALIMCYAYPRLSYLTRIWIIFVMLILLIAIFSCRKDFISGIKRMILAVKNMPVLFLAAMSVVLIGCFYVATHGEVNDDSRYYIGLVNTTVSTDVLYGANVYTGELTYTIYGRRALATFEFHSAVLSQWFQIPALVTTRVFRACQNVILTSFAVYLFAKEVFRKSDDCKRRALYTVIVFLLLQPVLTHTIYIPSTFFLFRAYEGKAFSANLIIIFVLYLLIRVIKEPRKRDIVLLLILMWGSSAISASAMILVPVEILIILTPIYVMKFFERCKRNKQCGKR